MIGGVQIDQQGRTSVDGLWAAGEVTSSGLHGANRLASNSLLEGLVYGAHAGGGASQAALDQPDTFAATPLENEPAAATTEEIDRVDIRNSLKSLMWRSAGVRRERDQLTDAANTIDGWCRYALSYQFSHPEGWELQNMLTVARTVIEAALRREESRGVHLRSDYPHASEAWRRRITIVRPAS